MQPSSQGHSQQLQHSAQQSHQASQERTAEAEGLSRYKEVRGDATLQRASLQRRDSSQHSDHSGSTADPRVCVQLEQSSVLVKQVTRGSRGHACSGLSSKVKQLFLPQQEGLRALLTCQAEKTESVAVSIPMDLFPTVYRSSAARQTSAGCRRPGANRAPHRVNKTRAMQGPHHQHAGDFPGTRRRHSVRTPTLLCRANTDTHVMVQDLVTCGRDHDSF